MHLQGDLIFPGRVTESLIPMPDGKSPLTLTAGQVCPFNSVKELLKLLFLGSMLMPAVHMKNCWVFLTTNLNKMNKSN